MAAKRGRDLLLKRETDTAGVFADAAGLRTKRLAFNAETVDATNQDSADRWRELLASAGVRSATISGSGVFKDEEVDEGVRADFFGSGIRNWQVVIPDFGTVEGPFQITQLEYAGEHNGEATYDLTLESAGALSFAAA